MSFDGHIFDMIRRNKENREYFSPQIVVNPKTPIIFAPKI